MEPGTWISLGAMMVALGALILNAWKAFRERRADVRRDREAATKSGAERDSIAVHSAEAALLLMEKMLATTTASEQRLQQKLDDCHGQLDSLRNRKANDE